MHSPLAYQQLYVRVIARMPVVTLKYRACADKSEEDQQAEFQFKMEARRDS